ncbi:MAG: proline dehydrogenase family protein [Planctomycetota bacterium]
MQTLLGRRIILPPLKPYVRVIPPFLVRFFARPYVAGDSLAKAMDTAADLLVRRGLLTTLDLLAEDIETDAAVRANLDAYLRMVDAASNDPRFPTAEQRPTLSLKLSSYTTSPRQSGGSATGSREAARQIVEAATPHGVRVTVDMESTEWTDYTLDFVRALHAEGHAHVGCVLQTRLHRTESDLDQLPAGCRVRLVIGIYQEPESVALTDKVAMKERMLDFGERLLRRGHYVEFATHDEVYVRRFVDDVVPRVGVSPDRFEVQMLYGVPRQTILADLVARGITARLYVPFALSWDMAISYLRRRLDEYPAMMWLVAKNLVRRG